MTELNISYAALHGGADTLVVLFQRGKAIADAGAEYARSSQSQREVAQLLFLIFSIFKALLDYKCGCGLGALPVQL